MNAGMQQYMQRLLRRHHDRHVQHRATAAPASGRWPVPRRRAHHELQLRRGKPERVKKTFFLILAFSFGFTTIASWLILLFPRPSCRSPIPSGS